MSALTLEECACRVLVPALGLELGFDAFDLALQIGDALLELGDRQGLEALADASRP